VTSTEPRARSSPPMVWSWPHTLTGVVYAIPATLTTLSNPQLGVPLAVGVLPPTLLAIPPNRRSRIVILIVGVMIGASLFIGGVLAHLPFIGTAALLVAAVVGAALLASIVPAGRLVLSLCAPLWRPDSPTPITDHRRQRSC
jgi:hypothetical protein